MTDYVTPFCVRVVSNLATVLILFYSAPMFDLKAYLAEQRRVVESALDEHMPTDTERPAVLHQAMRYCVFSEAKRIRPILCLATAKAIDPNCDTALMPGLALEVFHSYTLVHDDLPAMDDDDTRRGQPAAHVQYGEANAILVGDALLTLAFEWLAQCTAPPPYLPGQFVLELASAGGSHGVIAGQYEDLIAPTQSPSATTLDYIHLHKTAALIRAATRMGAIAAQANNQVLDACSLYGCNIGLAFQITDDILDETSDTETIGKPVGSDRKNNKLTYVSLHGLDPARQRANQLIADACDALDRLPGDTTPLLAIARYIVERTH